MGDGIQKSIFNSKQSGMKRSEFLKSTAGVIAGSGLLMSMTEPQANNQQIDRSVILPKALKPGDIIGVTAPAGSVWNKSHIEKVETIMRDLGFKTRMGKTLYEEHGYLAGKDEMRAAELMEMFRDSSVKAILTMRGGWGCARILDLLDYATIAKNPKILIGFSDITSLINVIYDQTGLITYHGPCGYSSWGDFSTDNVKKALASGEEFLMKNPPEYQDELKTWVSGKAQGKLMGGNLTVVATLIGTKYEPNWKNKILFLEEIGEEPYRIDRMLWQLKQASVFDQIKGLVIGSFRNCSPQEPHRSFSLDEVFDQHFSGLKYPVYQGAAFGHISPKFTLPIGVLAEMDADAFSIRTLERSVQT